MAAPPGFADGHGDDMNASLWGVLQSFVDLSMIYAKLPLAPFFRLRQVCKEWNRLASDRQFLEQNFKPPISSNPYFVLTPPSGRHVLLTSEGSSWSSTPVPRARCEVSGLLFEDSDRNRVFDLHTRVFHTLPPLPAVVQAPPLPVEEEDDYEEPLTLMSVDTTVIPYGFRVIISDQINGTRIYDSNSGAWTHKPSHKPSPHDYPHCADGTSCVHYNKSLYIRVEDASGVDILTYDLERDEWGSKHPFMDWDVYACGDIGVWQDRWFVWAVNHEFDDAESELVVLESPSNLEKSWNQFDCIPRDLCELIIWGPYMFLSKFCGEHVLLYCGVGDDAVLYNLDRKTWDKIEFLSQQRARSRKEL